MALTFPEFKARCRFSVKGDTVTGTIVIKDFEGKLRKIICQRPIAPTVVKLAEQSPVGWGIPGVDLDDGIDLLKSGAKAVVQNDVAKQLFKASEVAVKTGFKLAADPKVQAAINLAVPGSGQAIQLGLKAANLIGAATVGNSAAAKSQIAAIASKASAGDPAAMKAKAVLSSVYASGKSKNAWSATASRASSTSASRATGQKKSSFGVPLALGLGGLALLALL